MSDFRKAVEALADRWIDVLIECKQADARWITDSSVTTLEAALNELRAVLATHDEAAINE